MVRQKAIYVQEAYDHRKKLEQRVVEAVTVRESYLSKLSKLARDVNALRRKVDDECILESFVLLTLLRDATLDFGDAVEMWHFDFTRVVRPTLFETDYMAEMLGKQDILNTLRIRKLFKFQFSQCNLLLLPIHYAPKTFGPEAPPPVVSAELAKQMAAYANVPDERVIQFYRLMEKFMPKDVYKKLLPLPTYFGNRWVAPGETVEEPPPRRVLPSINRGRALSADRLGYRGRSPGKFGRSPTKASTLSPSRDKSKRKKRRRRRRRKKKAAAVEEEVEEEIESDDDDLLYLDEISRRFCRSPERVKRESEERIARELDPLAAMQLAADQAAAAAAAAAATQAMAASGKGPKSPSGKGGKSPSGKSPSAKSPTRSPSASPLRGARVPPKAAAAASAAAAAATGAAPGSAKSSTKAVGRAAAAAAGTGASVKLPSISAKGAPRAASASSGRTPGSSKPRK